MELTLREVYCKYGNNSFTYLFRYYYFIHIRVMTISNGWESDLRSYSSRWELRQE